MQLYVLYRSKKNTDGSWISNRWRSFIDLHIVCLEDVVSSGTSWLVIWKVKSMK